MTKFVPTVKIEFCTGCGICVRVCPEEIFWLDEGGKAVPLDPSKCLGCMICEENCPTDAIKVKEVEV